MNTKIIISALGGPEVLKVIKEAIPEPNENQVRVKIEYAGVAFAEILMRTISGFGLPKPPFTPGSDIVGVIDKIGSSVTTLKVGDRVGVSLWPQLGGYANYSCVADDQVVLMPKETDPVKAVAATMNYITAWQMLEKANVGKGSKLLVHGGGGGVGSALLDIARFKKAVVYATGSTGKQPLIRQFDAIGIDYRKDDFVEVLKRLEPNGVDVVFDSIGGSNLGRSYRVLAKKGQVISYGFSADFDKGMIQMMAGFVKVLGYNLLPDGKKVIVYQMRNDKEGKLIQLQKKLYQLVAEKKLNPVIHDVMVLEKAKEANQLLQEGKVAGKLVLDCR